MKDISKFTLPLNSKIRDAIEIIDKGSIGIAIIIDENNKVLGTVTDGDIRRSLLKGNSLEDNISETMNKNSTLGHYKDNTKRLKNLAEKKSINQIPLIDDNGILVDVLAFHNVASPQAKTNTVVLMAGGLGSRLKPLTDETPKPMLTVGTKPILENIIVNFKKHGFENFIICVNYLSEKVKCHFKDGSDLGVKITYIDETERLGTAGALSLLTDRPTSDFFVMNADLITTINFDHLMTYHNFEGATATLCVKEYDFKVPYGVIDVQENRVTKITEKPVQKCLINAGIYILKPDTLEYIPRGEYYDMPNFIQKLLLMNKKVVTFPIREYWIDVGDPKDLNKAQSMLEEINGK